MYVPIPLQLSFSLAYSFQKLHVFFCYFSFQFLSTAVSFKDERLQLNKYATSKLEKTFNCVVFSPAQGIKSTIALNYWQKSATAATAAIAAVASALLLMRIVSEYLIASETDY